MVWEGNGVVLTGRKIIGRFPSCSASPCLFLTMASESHVSGKLCTGATKPADAAPGTIRGDYCIDVGRNVIHGSDAVESAQKEIALWFPEGAPPFPF